MVGEELHVKRRWESWESVRGLSLSIRQTIYVGKADHHLPNHQSGVSWRSHFQPFTRLSELTIPKKSTVAELPGLNEKKQFRKASK